MCYPTRDEQMNSIQCFVWKAGDDKQHFRTGMDSVGDGSLGGGHGVRTLLKQLAAAASCVFCPQAHRPEGEVTTANFGSENITAKACARKKSDLRNTLRCLRALLEEAPMMFGHSQTAVDAALVPCSKIKKRHNAISCHGTSAAGITQFHHVLTDTDPSGIPSKH